MTTQEFLDLFEKNVRADIDDGDLDRADLQHIKEIALEMCNGIPPVTPAANQE